MVAARVEVPLDSSAGALDAESFSQKEVSPRPLQDRETREPGQVRGQPQSWPGLPRGQLLYSTRARPCPRTRWPRLLPLPPTPPGGPRAPAPHYYPHPTPTPASGSSPVGGSRIRRGGQRWLAPAPVGGWGAEGGMSEGEPLDWTFNQEERAPGTDARVSRPAIRATGSHLTCPPSIPNLTRCTRLLAAGHQVTLPAGERQLASQKWGREWVVEFRLRCTLGSIQCDASNSGDPPGSPDTYVGQRRPLLEQLEGAGRGHHPPPPTPYPVFGSGSAWGRWKLAQGDSFLLSVGQASKG